MNLPATIQMQVDPRTRRDLTRIELETIHRIMDETCFKLNKLNYYVRAEMYLGQERWYPNV